MALQLGLYGKIKVYTGKSTDIKPVGVGIRPGYQFIESDTGRIFIYDGNQWIQTRRTYYYMCNTTGNLTANNFYGIGTDTGSATESARQFLIPAQGNLVIKNLQFKVTTAPGTGNSWTATVRKNGVNTALTTTISGNATSSSNTSNIVSISGGDLLSVIVTSSGTPAGSGVSYISFEIETL